MCIHLHVHMHFFACAYALFCMYMCIFLHGHMHFFAFVCAFFCMWSFIILYVYVHVLACAYVFLLTFFFYSLFLLFGFVFAWLGCFFFNTPVVKRECSWFGKFHICVRPWICKIFLLSKENRFVSYLIHFSTNCSQILDSKSYDQA